MRLAIKYKDEKTQEFIKVAEFEPTTNVLFREWDANQPKCEFVAVYSDEIVIMVDKPCMIIKNEYGSNVIVDKAPVVVS